MNRESNHPLALLHRLQNKGQLRRSPGLQTHRPLPLPGNIQNIRRSPHPHVHSLIRSIIENHPRRRRVPTAEAPGQGGANIHRIAHLELTLVQPEFHPLQSRRRNPIGR